MDLSATARLPGFDSYINNALDQWKIPGVALAVIQRGEVLHAGGYGFRDLDRQLPISENTLFPIASMTKPFTAMGAGILVEMAC